MFSIHVNTESQEYRAGSAWALAGIAFQFAGELLVLLSQGNLTSFELFLFLVGAGLLVRGILLIARSKARSPFWAVLGLLSFFGWILVAFLEDRSPDAEGRREEPECAIDRLAMRAQ